ncbi:MAG: hypothetical protein P8Z37_02430 [Acidobacteriota bacterium]
MQYKPNATEICRRIKVECLEDVVLAKPNEIAPPIERGLTLGTGIRFGIGIAIEVVVGVGSRIYDYKNILYTVIDLNIDPDSDSDCSYVLNRGKI